MGRCDCVWTGNRTGDAAHQIVKTVLQKASVPVVLDADALNIISEDTSVLLLAHTELVITPHLGEMSRLTGKSIGEIRENLAETASLYAEETHTVCVLKDACTVVASEKGKKYLNMSGNAGMATAGSGDVLSGVLAGVLCMFLAAEKKPAYGQMAALGVTDPWTGRRYGS